MHTGLTVNSGSAPLKRNLGAGVAGGPVQATLAGQMRGESSPKLLSLSSKVALEKIRSQKQTFHLIQGWRAEWIVCAESTSFPVILQKGGRWHFSELLKYGPLSTR